MPTVIFPLVLLEVGPSSVVLPCPAIMGLKRHVPFKCSKVCVVSYVPRIRSNLVMYVT